jgi:hypothetical protein
VAQVEKAFRVAIDNFDVNGETIYANISDLCLAKIASQPVSRT